MPGASARAMPTWPCCANVAFSLLNRAACVRAAAACWCGASRRVTRMRAGRSAAAICSTSPTGICACSTRWPRRRWPDIPFNDGQSPRDGMTPAEATALDPTDAFARALAEERLHNGRRICWLRFIGVSGFLLLTVVLGTVADPGWYGNLWLFGAYWLIAAALLWHSRRAAARLQFVGFDIALVDIPLAFLLLGAVFGGGPPDRGTAGFSIGFYILLVTISALALDVRAIVLS